GPRDEASDCERRACRYLAPRTDGPFAQLLQALLSVLHMQGRERVQANLDARHFKPGEQPTDETGDVGRSMQHGIALARSTCWCDVMQHACSSRGAEDPRSADSATILHERWKAHSADRPPGVP